MSDAATSQLPGAADFCLLIGICSICPCSHQLRDKHIFVASPCQAVSPALLLTMS